MQLVEKHIIDRTHWLYKQLDNLCFLSKNLFNYAALPNQTKIYHLRRIPRLLQNTETRSGTDYVALPAKVSQQVLLRLNESWKSFFEATKEYAIHPEKFKARPKIPRYKHKTLGRNVLTYTAQAISKEWLKKGIINLSKTQIFLTTKVRVVNQVRIVPKTYHYSMEVVYEPKDVSQSSSGVEGIAGIDMGLNNLATITSNQKGLVPLIINGKPLKSINAYYHKNKTVFQSYLKGERKTSIKIEQLTHKGHVKVDNYLHNASRFIINHLAANRIGTLVIGKNDNWKQRINLGKRNNQNFVAIPHARFIEMLTYKAQLAGIVVKVIEETYTSKCSFLDNEPCVKHSEYKGKRIKRGLFRAGDGRLINADVNGSANIVKKAFPNAFAEGIQGVVVRPVRIAPYKMVVRGKCNICL